MNESVSRLIIDALKSHDGPMQTFFLKKALPSDAVSSGEFNTTLTELLMNGTLTSTPRGLVISQRSIKDLRSKNPKFSDYLDGLTFRQLAEKYSDDPETIKDGLKECLTGVFIEDRYADDFRKFYMTQTQFIELYGERKETYRYLQLRYRSGTDDLSEMLNDSCPESIRNRLVPMLNKTIDAKGESVDFNPVSILEHILSKAEKPLEPREALSRYNAFIKKSEIPYTESLSIVVSSIPRICDQENHILCDKDSTIRYFPHSADEIKSLFERIDFSQYKDMYISSALVFKNHKDLMNEYDIQSEYQLYYLMRKYERFIRKLKPRFVRIPSVCFGKGDMDKQIERMLMVESPIPVSDFMRKFEDKYGIKGSSLRSSYLTDYRKYVVNLNGVEIYDMKVNRLNKNRLEKLKPQFTSPLYTIDDAKHKFIKSLGSTYGLESFNAYNLETLGYTLSKDVVFSNSYSSLTDCISEMLKGERIKMTGKLWEIRSIQTVLNQKKRRMEILPISDDEYVSIKFLEEHGIDKSMLNSFVDSILDSVSEGEYFTLHHLIKKGFVHELYDKGYEDVFYSAILEADQRIQSSTINHVHVFVKAESYSRTDALESMVYNALDEEDSMDEYDVIDSIFNQYGIELESELKNNDSTYYYNANSMKIYRDKTVYYEELRRFND